MEVFNHCYSTMFQWCSPVNQITRASSIHIWYLYVQNLEFFHVQSASERLTDDVTVRANRWNMSLFHYRMWLVIIPLRPYLETIKGCRRPDIFRIRPWARHSRIVSGSECVSLCRCTRITARFPLTREHAHVFSAQQRRVWTICFACFCAYFQHAL